MRRDNDQVNICTLQLLPSKCQCDNGADIWLLVHDRLVTGVCYYLYYKFAFLSNSGSAQAFFISVQVPILTLLSLRLLQGGYMYPELSIFIFTSHDGCLICIKRLQMYYFVPRIILIPCILAASLKLEFLFQNHPT